MEKMTREQKDRQIRKEARATLLLFVICFAWHVGFGYGLAGLTDVRILNLPIWWWMSTPGVFVVAIVGVVILLKTVFKDFSLDDDEPSIVGESIIQGAETTAQAAGTAQAAAGEEVHHE